MRHVRGCGGGAALTYPCHPSLSARRIEWYPYTALLATQTAIRMCVRCSQHCGQRMGHSADAHSGELGGGANVQRQNAYALARISSKAMTSGCVRCAAHPMLRDPARPCVPRGRGTWHERHRLPGRSAPLRACQPPAHPRWSVPLRLRTCPCIALCQTPPQRCCQQPRHARRTTWLCRGVGGLQQAAATAAAKGRQCGDGAHLAQVDARRNSLRIATAAANCGRCTGTRLSAAAVLSTNQERRPSVFALLIGWEQRRCSGCSSAWPCPWSLVPVRLLLVHACHSAQECRHLRRPFLGGPLTGDRSRDGVPHSECACARRMPPPMLSFTHAVATVRVGVLAYQQYQVRMTVLALSTQLTRRRFCRRSKTQRIEHASQTGSYVLSHPRSATASRCLSRGQSESVCLRS